MPWLNRSIACLAFAMMLGPTCVHGQLVPTRNHRAISLAFLRMTSHGHVLADKECEIGLSFTTANDFRKVATLEEDAEVERLLATIRWGFRDHEVFVEVPLLSRGGGFLDPIIDGWHANVLGWTDPARDAAPFGRSVIARAGAYHFGSASGVGDITVGVARAVSDRTTARLAIKLPTGNARKMLGSGALDAGVAVEHSLPLDARWTLTAMAGLVAQGRASELPGARGIVDQEAVSLSYRPNSRDLWIAQWNSERAPVTTGIPGPDSTHRIITFAYRRILSERTELELFFSEDRDLFNGRVPQAANIGPDFTAGVRLTWRR